MNNRIFIMAGIGGFVLLMLAALWILLQPPRSAAGVAGSLSASNPALGIRYSYDPAHFQPAPFDPTAEFPLRADSADWSFYGKRIRGVANLLMREPAPVLYGFITESASSEYTEFYKLQLDGAGAYDEIQLSGQRVLRQQLKLRRTEQSLGWPAFFPDSVTAGAGATLLPPREQAEEAFRLPEELRPVPEHEPSKAAAERAWLYGWALFEGEDLYLFQAVAGRELNAAELQQAERLIESIQYNALQGST